MSFPKQERFTVQRLATYWARPVDYIEDLLRTVQFSYIIVVGQHIGGVVTTQHLYFELPLWIEHFGKQLESACASAREEVSRKIDRYRIEWAEKGVSI
jgi:hypothetical protein